MAEQTAPRAGTSPSPSRQTGNPPHGGKRRGVRVNSRVPVALEWDMGGELRRREAHTRVVGPYGCLVVMPQNLEAQQHIQLTNLVSSETSPAVVVWCGQQRTEGWELGIELVSPHMGFWGLDL